MASTSTTVRIELEKASGYAYAADNKVSIQLTEYIGGDTTSVTAIVSQYEAKTLMERLSKVLADMEAPADA